MSNDKDAATEEFARYVNEQQEGIEVADTVVSSETVTEPAAPTYAASPATAAATPDSKHRKMLTAAFVLGIVGTSLAFIALIVGIAGFGHGGSGGRTHDRVEVTISEEFMEEQGQLPGRDGRMEMREFTEDMREQMSGTRGQMRERVLQEDIETGAQSS
ncbi:MAG: hypothetical protein WAS54_08190 [Scrofimicrobium sp.]